MATIVSQLSQALEVYLSAAQEIIIHAKKTAKLGDKNVAQLYADVVNYLIGTNGRLTGFDISVNGSNITLAPGKFLYEGLVAESNDSTTITDPGTFSQPYYLYGYAENDTTVGSVQFGLSQDSTGSFALIATYDGSWSLENSLELGYLWRTLWGHIGSNDIHADADLQDYIDPPTLPSSINPYATRKDLYTYDRSIDANHMLTALMTLIELETNSASTLPQKFHLDNMFADVIPVSNESKPCGKYGTFYNAWANDFEGKIGLYGVYNDSDAEYTFETGVIANVNDISNHILVSAKQTTIEATFGVEYDIMTDGSTYPITHELTDIVLDSTALEALDKSPNGTYDLQLRFRLPVVSGGSYWTTKQNLTNETCMQAAQFLNNKLYSIGGSDDGLIDSGIQEYSLNNDSFAIFLSSFDRRALATTKDEFLNKVHIFNSYNSATTVVSNISELTLSNQSVANVATGLNAWGTTAANNGEDYVKSMFGTGKSGALFLDDWKLYNNFTKSVTTKVNYPIECTGVSSASSRYVARKAYNYGAHTVGGTSSSLITYDAFTESFTTITPTEVSSPNSTIKSFAESAIFTLKKTLFIAGRTTGDFGSESFNPEVSEYNIYQNTLTGKTNMSSNIGHNAVELASNGRMYSLGGRLGNAGANLSSDLNYEYTPDAMVYMYGWGIEWL